MHIGHKDVYERKLRQALRNLLCAALLIAAVGSSCPCLAYETGDPEYRAFWIDAWHAGALNQTQVNTLLGVVGNGSSLGQIREANCNTVFVQVRRNADTLYPSGIGEPYMSGLTPADFNGLQAVINAAHDTTGGKQRIDVHAWIVTYRTNGGAAYAAHHDTPTGSLTDLDNYWICRDDSGAEVSDEAFDPGHPKAQEYTINACMDVVNNFDIDGIHLDYVRFTAPDQGYNPTSIARYNARYGLTGQPNATDAQFKQWRRDQITALVRQLYARIQAVKPWVKQSGSFFTGNPSPTSSTRQGFEDTRPYYEVYSDWDSWLQEGILDMAVPMTYYDYAVRPDDYANWMNYEKDRHGNRHMIIGPGIYMNSLSDAILEIQMTRDPSPSGNYAHGFSGYSYNLPYADGNWAGFSPSFISGVTSGGAAPIPDMPWKSSPTKGHISGTVTHQSGGAWADGALVTLTGPENRTQYCDGTGFYAFIDLTPGTYTVTVSQSGYANAAREVAVTLGSVTGDMFVNDFQLSLPLPPPAISEVAVSGLTATSASITWTTDQPSTSQAHYGMTAAYGSETTLDSTNVTSHTTNLNGLSPSTIYHYRVASTNENGSSYSEDYTFTTAALPAISDIQVINITGTEATITWTTSQASSSRVDYGITSGYGSSTPTDESDVLSHSVTLTGLLPGTSYHYRVVSANDNGTAVSDDSVFATVGFPIISNVQAGSIAGTSATITWATDIGSSSQVEYGLTTAYGSVTVLDNDPVVAHSVHITGLVANTEYNYRVKSSSAAGTSTSTNCTFRTDGPPEISDIQVINITGTEATITWTTSQASSSRVDYGITSGYGSSTPKDEDEVLSHSMTLTGLSPGTSYHYRVVSANDNGTAISGDLVFATIGLPMVSNVQAGSITSTSATITWATDIASNSQVEYGLTTGYGSLTVLDNDPVVAHSVHITGLAANTEYNYRVKSSGAAGTSTSANYTFRTDGPPAISDIQVINITGAAATIMWTTDKPSDSAVNYGLTTGYGSQLANADLVTHHSISINGLTRGTTYHFQCVSANAYGPDTSADCSFTTSSAIDDVIVDNTDPGWRNTSPNGNSWTIDNLWPEGKIGANCFNYKGDGSTTASGVTRKCTWTPNLQVNGLYDVYAYYQTGADRNRTAPFKVYYSGSSLTSVQNQYKNTALTGWYLLGSDLPFTAGSAGYVELTTLSTDRTGLIGADATKWVYKGPVDLDPPVVTIGAPSASVTARGPVTYIVYYQCADFVSLTASQVILNRTGTARASVAVTGAGTSMRTVTLSSVSGNGTLSISIAPGTARDSSGNRAAGSGPGQAIVVDNAAPTVSISAPSVTSTSRGPVDYLVTYTGADTITLTEASITLVKKGTANGTLSVTGSGASTRTVRITNISGDGSLGISVARGTASDAAGNAAPAPRPSSKFAVDNTAPTLTIGSPSIRSTAAGPVSYVVSYKGASEITLSAADITLHNTGDADGVVAVTGTGTSKRTVTISSLTGSGALGIRIAAGSATDPAGNKAAAVGPSSTVSVDNSPPVMEAVHNETYTASTNTLKASWSAFDIESGIKRYEYAVGTTPLGTQIKAWTSAGTKKSATITSLRLSSGNTYYISVRAVNGMNLVSSPMSSAGVEIAQTVTSIKVAKSLPDGRLVSLPARVVSAAFPGAFYIEESNQTSGIRVESDNTLIPGKLVKVMGRIGTSANGERAILEVVMPSPPQTGTPIKPVTAAISAVGGATEGCTPGPTGGTGPNNVGLLVRITGTVTALVSDGFYLDDGSGITDDTGCRGIKVWTGLPSSAIEGAALSITGPVSLRRANESLYAQVLRVP